MKVNDYYLVLGELRAAMPALDSKGCEINLILNKEAISVDINHYSKKRKKIESISIIILDDKNKDNKMAILRDTLEDITWGEAEDAIIKNNDRYIKLYTI